MGHHHSHNHKISAVIVFLLLAIVSFIVSCSSYWYYVKATSTYSDSSASINVYIKFAKESITTSDGTNKATVETDIKNETGSKNTYQLLEATFAMTVLNIILAFIAVISMMVSSSSHGHHTGRGGIIFSRIVSLLIILLGSCTAAAFATLPSAQQTDCLDLSLASSTDVSTCDRKSFFGHDDTNNYESTYGPYVGWYLNILGSIFAAIGAIIYNMHGHHKHHEYSAI